MAKQKPPLDLQQHPLLLPISFHIKSKPPADDLKTACEQPGVLPGQVVFDSLVDSNFLGEGQFRQVYQVNSHNINNFVLRVPFGNTANHLRGQNLTPESLHYHETNTQHPWRQRDNMGIPIAYFTTSDNQIIAEVQRFIPNRSAGSYYEKLDEAIYFVKSLLSSSNSEEEFNEKLREARESGEHDEDFQAYDAFQTAYAQFIHNLAEMPQEAYDEVAEIMAEGWQNGVALDINHANNTHLIVSDPTTLKPDRFGFVDTRLLDGNPFYQPMRMIQFFYALTTNIDPPDVRAFRQRRFLIQDLALKEQYQQDFETAMTKCEQADVKHHLETEMERYTASLRNEQAQPRIISEASPKASKVRTFLNWLGLGRRLGINNKEKS